MFGIALALFSSLFEEAANSIGKKEVAAHVASVYTFGFLGLLFSTSFFFCEGALRHTLVFSVASLPTFIPRLLLEMLQAYVTVKAITISDRGDFGFFKTLTIPVLLVVDFALGYSVGMRQILGMVLVLLPIGILIALEWKKIKGLSYLVIGTINAAVTISLYKYDITHFNSVEAEQALLGIALLAFFLLFALLKARENPFRYLRIPVFATLSVSNGLSGVAASFAYSFAPASVIATVLRSFSVLFAIATGRFYFHEKHLLLRAASFVLVTAGLLLLIPLRP